MATITIQKHKPSAIFTILFIISSNFIPLIDSHQFSTQLSKKDMGLKMPKITLIHFYFNDKLSGPNPTAIRIVDPVAKSKTFFGALVMIDDALTIGPDLSSGIMGRAQGFYGGAGLEHLEFLMIMNYVFNENSEYNGSTLSVLGRNPITEDVREMPIVGGTGVFRFAKGFAQAKTILANGQGMLLWSTMSQSTILSNVSNNSNTLFTEFQ